MPDKYTTSNFVSRFIGFDRMLGSFLIKVLYHLGLIVILALTVLGVVAALTGYGDAEFNPALGALASVIGGVLAVIVWRYICEISILLFQIYNRLGEIRDRLPEIAHEKKLASHV